MHILQRGRDRHFLVWPGAVDGSTGNDGAIMRAGASRIRYHAMVARTEQFRDNPF